MGITKSRVSKKIPQPIRRMFSSQIIRYSRCGSKVSIHFIFGIFNWILRNEKCREKEKELGSAWFICIQGYPTHLSTTCTKYLIRTWWPSINSEKPEQEKIPHNKIIMRQKFLFGVFNNISTTNNQHQLHRQSQQRQQRPSLDHNTPTLPQGCVNHNFSAWTFFNFLWLI